MSNHKEMLTGAMMAVVLYYTQGWKGTRLQVLSELLVKILEFFSSTRT